MTSYLGLQKETSQLEMALRHLHLLFKIQKKTGSRLNSVDMISLPVQSQTLSEKSFFNLLKF